MYYSLVYTRTQHKRKKVCPYFPANIGMGGVLFCFGGGVRREKKVYLRRIIIIIRFIFGISNIIMESGKKI